MSKLIAVTYFKGEVGDFFGVIGESVSLAFFIRRQPEREKTRRERENERLDYFQPCANHENDPAMKIPIGKIPSLQCLLTWQAEKFTIFNRRCMQLEMIVFPLSCWFSRGASPEDLLLPTSCGANKFTQLDTAS